MRIWGAAGYCTDYCGVQYWVKYFVCVLYVLFNICNIFTSFLPFATIIIVGLVTEWWRIVPSDAEPGTHRLLFGRSSLGLGIGAVLGLGGFSCCSVFVAPAADMLESKKQSYIKQSYWAVPILAKYRGLVFCSVFTNSLIFLTHSHL